MNAMHPYILKWGPITIWSYGLMLDLGFLLGAVLAAREADRRGIGGAWMYDLLLAMLLVGVVASRALYVLLNLSLYVSNPWTILNITEGGLALHGALLGGLIVAIWFCRRKKISFYDLADTVAPSLALGIAVARWGCLLNGCCYGVPTTGKWGVLTRYAPGLRHPTQIYESLLAFGLFAFLWWARQRTRIRGQLFMLFLMLYSVIRFLVEFFRESSYIGPLTHAQAASLAIALLALWWFFRLERQATAAATAGDSATASDAATAGDSATASDAGQAAPRLAPEGEKGCDDGDGDDDTAAL
ncbi:MAG: prolipoprotein diacylglyceryl transferase [Ignavibacteriales bacterium]